MRILNLLFTLSVLTRGVEAEEKDDDPFAEVSLRQLFAFGTTLSPLPHLFLENESLVEWRTCLEGVGLDETTWDELLVSVLTHVYTRTCIPLPVTSLPLLTKSSFLRANTLQSNLEESLHIFYLLPQLRNDSYRSLVFVGFPLSSFNIRTEVEQ